ncbi:tannase/feruloyl esterase family alpha/beta hydrolase [Paraburkholderia adhaesiva]|uniref:tannase/feruloyl esterase family alpha/beta hydrolase n=1 Tax=Paraburkholderia adhaesiva TaxID=2883244 RepID=UPI0027E3E7C5|nr:tannase/feruloyl esterase family alpha/beta hydrolase [Paraburkholderia adhaesiva]
MASTASAITTRASTQTSCTPITRIYDATNHDLSAFQKAGSTLILWHGGVDQRISLLVAFQYYESMQNTICTSN